MNLGVLKSKALFAGMTLKKASPHIMVILGVAGMIYTVVKSCSEARKLDEVIKDEMEELSKAEKELEDLPKDTPVETIKESKKKVRSLRWKTIKKGGKRFIVPTLVGLASICLIGGSHVILSNRLFAASAAFKAVSSEYKDYRDAVKTKYGEEVDKELRFAKLKEDAVEAEVIEKNEETGEDEIKTVITGIGKNLSGFAFPFCKTYCGSNFVGNHHIDTCTIASNLEQLNGALIRKKRLFLSEVYDRFGFDQTPESRRFGWLIHENGEPNGDGIVKFAIEEGYFDWGNGPEYTYIIDLNVDGEIDELLPKPRKKWWNAA